MTSSYLLSLALVLCPQDPPPAPATGAQDVVLLKNGDRLEGRIKAQLDGYVEIEIEAGATIGLSMAQVQAIQRGAGAAAPAGPGPLPPRSEWFVLYDGCGAPVGWLQAGVASPGGDTVTVSEEYEFHEGRRRYQITSLCTAAYTEDGVLRPQSCYFRERISEPVLGVTLVPGETHGAAERIVDERIVEGTCRSDRLVVTRLDRSGRKERELPWSAQHTFPLLARAVARHTGAAQPETTMFDPVADEVVLRTIDAARSRRVQWDGKPLSVTEIAESSASGRNSTWIDANSGMLRRELAGPALVAVRSEADVARRMAGGAPIESSFVVEAGGTFACWRPNPAWRVGEELPPGRIVLEGVVPDSTISLLRIDHLEPGATLDAAADAVANWFALLHPELSVSSRVWQQIRDRSAVRLFADGRRTRASIDVVAHGAGFLAIVCHAPRAAWDELQPDFDFVARSVELDAAAIAPRLQGPLEARQPRAPSPSPSAQKPAAEPPRELPRVRVPTDG